MISRRAAGPLDAAARRRSWLGPLDGI